MSLSRLPVLALVAALAGPLAGCQKSDEHPPFVAGCASDCPLLPGISTGPGAPSTTPGADAGVGSLQGHVLLLADDSFVHSSLYGNGATVTADGASGSPVTTTWDGIDPYVLEGVALAATNWVSVQPDLVGGDPLPTYQAVRTNQVSNVDLAIVSSTTLDAIFNEVSALRNPASGQLILFFRSAGTGAALSGLHVTLPAAQAAVYASANGWLLDDGTALTSQSGLVLFGNVDASKSNAMQSVIVTHAATPAAPAVEVGRFAVKVAQGAVTIATVSVQL